MKSKPPREEGLPDGATMDAEATCGLLAGRQWHGPLCRDETIERTILVLARKVASLTFGGPGLDDIYITTANLKDPDPNDEFLYRGYTCIRAMPEFCSRIAFP